MLTNLQFAVCALGDSSYEHFCKTGKDIDRRLDKLGAIRFHQRVDCDVEFHQAASGWVSEVLGKYSEKTESAPVQINTENLHRLYPATVKEKLRLNEGSPSETYHIALTTISKKLLENYQKLTQNPDLEKLLTDEKKLQDYIRHHDVPDVILEYPFPANRIDFIAVLRKLQPRYYSIASSQRKYPGEVHLIVKLVQSKQNGRIRSGASSSYLNHWIEVGQKINV